MKAEALGEARLRGRLKQLGRPGPAMSYPIVAIVGRPNVGKSTLFNRLVGRRLAITAEEPGTTRDRLIADVEWEGRRFAIVDTAGLVSEPRDSLHQAMMAQARLAIQDATAIIFLTDVTDGVTAPDQDVADLLRRSGKPVVLAANKCDTRAREAGAAEFYRLGLGDPAPISAYHNQGIGALLDRVVGLLPSTPPETPPEGMRLAIVGRPNVGKSMLLNALVGEERAVVSEMPGTTRDSVDTVLSYQAEKITLVDTAGIRRKGRIEVGVEKFSVLRALQAIERADVALIVLDAAELGSAQDAHIGGYVAEAHKGLVLVVNKWDLAEGLGLEAGAAERLLRGRFKFAPFAPVLYTSALKRTGLEAVLATARRVYEQRLRRVPTAALNRAIERAIGAWLPPPVGNRRLHVLFVTQAGVNPPTFVFSVNDPKLLHFSYRRYLENRLREEFGFQGTPLRFIFKARGEG